MLKIDFQSPRAIRYNVNVQEQFPGKDESDITSVLWSFKNSDRDDDDAILLKDLMSGVTKSNQTLEDGTEVVRISTVLTSIDWQSLEPKVYLIGLGIKFDTDDPSDDHHEIYGDSEGAYLRIKVVRDLLRG